MLCLHACFYLGMLCLHVYLLSHDPFTYEFLFRRVCFVCVLACSYFMCTLVLHIIFTCVCFQSACSFDTCVCFNSLSDMCIFSFLLLYLHVCVFRFDLRALLTNMCVCSNLCMCIFIFAYSVCIYVFIVVCSVD